MIGTTSATVIQSRPSMKFTRLTNHNPPRPARRSIHTAGKRNAQLTWQRVDHEATAQRLQKKAGRDANRANVVGSADNRDQNDGSGESNSGPVAAGADK